MLGSNFLLKLQNGTVVPQKIKHKVTIWSSNPPGCIYPIELKSRELNRYWYTHVHSSVIHNSQMCEQLKYPWTDEWINKIWSTLPTQYYPATKSNENLICATTWMNLEVILLSEISQTRKKTESITVLMWSVWNSQIHWDWKEKPWWLPGTEWREKQMKNYCLMGAEFHFGKIKTFWRRMVVMVVEQYECT